MSLVTKSDLTVIQFEPGWYICNLAMPFTFKTHNWVLIFSTENSWEMFFFQIECPSKGQHSEKQIYGFFLYSNKDLVHFYWIFSSGPGTSAFKNHWSGTQQRDRTSWVLGRVWGKTWWWNWFLISHSSLIYFNLHLKLTVGTLMCRGVNAKLS